jgi:hypothetical protein
MWWFADLHRPANGYLYRRGVVAEPPAFSLRNGSLIIVLSNSSAAQRMNGFAKRRQVTQRKGVHGVAMKTPSIRNILMPIRLLKDVSRPA